MTGFIKLLKTTGIPCTKDIRGFSPQLRGDCDCIGGNCDGGWGACECNCDCADEWRSTAPHILYLI